MANPDTVKYEAVYSKKGDSVFISHLDVMTLFRRAIRRVSLPFVLTKGFTPRVRISMPEALKLGKESDNEKMAFWLEEEREPGVLMDEVNSQLPEGIRIRGIKRI
ncbi:MAG: DUF2344 domain-containing protein [Candidatus Omnitrophica bacterium]|nr:DUF2344 domain-containing protein [Candidatus Omnitrophota bacterium]